MTSDLVPNQILEAAGPVFADKGFDGATVREICKTAGVNLAAVNYYFRDKQRLYVEVVRLAYRMRSEQVPMPEWPAEAAPAEMLTDFIRTLATRMLVQDRAPWQARLLMREVLRPTEACRNLVEEYFRPQFEQLLGILDQILPADTPLHRRHQVAFSIVGQCMFYRVAGSAVALMIPADELEQHFSADRLADHIAAVSLTALGQLPDLFCSLPEWQSTASHSE